MARLRRAAPPACMGRAPLSRSEQKRLAPRGAASRTDAPFKLRRKTLEAAPRHGRGGVRLLGRARAPRPLLVGGRELLARTPRALRRRLHTLGRTRKARGLYGTPARRVGRCGGLCRARGAVG